MTRKQSAKIVSNFSQENKNVTVVSNSQMCHKQIQLGFTQPRCILIPKTNTTKDAYMSSPAMKIQIQMEMQSGTIVSNWVGLG